MQTKTQYCSLNFRLMKHKKCVKMKRQEFNNKEQNIDWLILKKVIHEKYFILSTLIISNIMNYYCRPWLIGGPDSEEKRLYGPQFNGKKLQRAVNHYESLQNDLSMSIILLVFEMFASNENASGGPHAARGPLVWDSWFRICKVRRIL